MEIFHIRGTAQFPAADTITADDLGFVAHADLFELNAHPQYFGQVLNQVAEIHPAFGRKVDQYLGRIKGIFRLD